MENKEIKDGNNLSQFIWTIADELWGDFKHVDFARIILPLLLLRRVECVIEPTREAVLKKYNDEKESGIDLEMVLPHVSGFPFYNTSQYTLATLGSTNTQANLEDYVSKFSPNARKAFEGFDFINTINKLAKAKLLYRMVSAFADIDLHPNVVSDRVMSNAYEHLIQKFAATVNEKASEFMTPKDISRFVTKAVLSSDEEIFNNKGVIRTIYDPTCGIGGFLSDGIGQIKELSPTARIIPFGQELDPETHALALISMMIQGFDTENIKQGNTLSDDQLSDQKFHYGLANPPFGIKWEKAKEAVEAERESLGYSGRFGAGLPKISDGSMLFIQHLVSKMELPENGGGRIGIVLSGSPLFNGAAGSGESEIRRWLFENDLVEAIFALPTDLFFNTSIGTYVWLLSNKKEATRKDKVQLINLVDTWTPMRKSEGKKRRFISEEQINDILREYDSFTESEITKIFDTTDFGYRKITVERPLRVKMAFTRENVDALHHVKALDKVKTSEKEAFIDLFEGIVGKELMYDDLKSNLKTIDPAGDFGKPTASTIKALLKNFMVRDEASDAALDDKGHPIVDTELRDTENVPLKESIDDYFEREVLPHVPDAWIDKSKVDEKDGEAGIVGYEINFNRYFHKYQAPRSLHDIDMEMRGVEAEISELLDEVTENV